MTLEDRTLLLEISLKRHLQDTIMPDAGLHEIFPVLKVMMKYFTSGNDLEPTYINSSYLVKDKNNG